MATSSELIKGWLQYAKTNGIKAGRFDGRPAEDDDLKDFLVSNGIDETVVNNVLSGLDLAKSQSDENKEEKLSDDQIRYLNRAKKTIKNLSPAQRQQLYRELKSD